MVKNFSSSSHKIYEKKYKKEKYIENVKKDRNDLQKLVEKNIRIFQYFYDQSTS